ncbi:MAG: hypothetical protein ACREPD_06170 [Stenotrophomonas sp.]|uniref:hypothetical protein n=1 Tax=Stenotrophomonas sp. TaxID=69392 RepID=UPI003D6D0766
MAHSDPAAEVMALAAQIADRTVRCDIELFARDTWIDDVQHFDLTAPRLYDEDVEMVRDAVMYIQLRGDVFPWVMHRHPIHSHMVRFEEKKEEAR